MAGAASPAGCPAESFIYNLTQCACAPGRYLPVSGNGSCVALGPEWDLASWNVSSGVSPSLLPLFLTSVLSLDSVRRLTQSQAVLLEVTAAVLLAWLLFCATIRLAGRRWLHSRWSVSRLDFLFHSQHWTDDQQVLKKRKTELGGTFSVSVLILFIGLLTALLYQVVTKRSIEVHRVRPANAPDLLSFVNDMEFNVTTVSSMSCSHFHAPDSLVVSTPGFIDYRVFPISMYIQSSCRNTSQGPAVSLKCNNCRIPRRNHFISWHFVDLPGSPAAAVGFEFSLSAKDRGRDEHVSFVSGKVKSDDFYGGVGGTLRGPQSNILQIRLVPQAYNNLRGLKIVQPLVQDFVPGSSFSDVSSLRASLENPVDGLVNITLQVSYFSDYVMEIDKERVMGPVTILANIGGLYAVCIAIFLCLLVNSEARVKKLRDEDARIQNILSRRRAQRNWDKLRKYVMYTWGPSDLIPADNPPKPKKKMKPIKARRSPLIPFGKREMKPIKMEVINIEDPGDTQNSSAVPEKGSSSSQPQ